MSEETIDISKLSEEAKESIEKTYYEIWDMYAKARHPFGRSHKGLKAWVEHLLEMGKEGEDAV